MSPTRRDLFKIAAGLGLTGAIPTVAERIAAAESLSVPISDSMVDDPAAFAEETQLLVGYHSDFTNEWISAICPEESADERQKLQVVHQFFPHIGPTATPEANAVNDYSDTAFHLAIAMYDAGVRHGAAYENLRRSVIGEIRACWPCRGIGATKAGKTCTSCGGTGTVAINA